MKIKAFIFDLDGVVTDTEPIHMDAWLEVLEPIGIAFDEDEYRKNYLGLNDRDFLDYVGRIHGHHFSDAEKAYLIEVKTKSSINLMEHDIPLFSGVEDFVDRVSADHILAICSGANRAEIEYILKHLGWAKRFEPIIASDSVKRGKPDPEGYIRTLEGLVERSNDIILPENVIAIEDSPKGIAAAKAAGLRCVAVKTSYGKDDLKSADWIVDMISEFDYSTASAPKRSTRGNIFSRIFNRIADLV